MAANRGVVSLFRGLTALRAGFSMATAAVTFVLLVWLPVATFVAGTVPRSSFAAVALTIVWSPRTAPPTARGS